MSISNNRMADLLRADLKVPIKPEWENGSMTDIVFMAKTPVREKLLQFLARIPLLRDMPVVQAYVKQTRLQNQQLLAQFITTLSSIYSEKQLLSATESLSLKQTKPLTSHDLKVLTNKIENYHGIGDAKNLPRQVQINIWPGRGFHYPGHSSLTVKNEYDDDSATHISWWPEGGVSSKQDKLWAKFKADIIENYETDASSEVAKRTQSRLDAFNEIREQHQYGSINKVMRSAINGRMNAYIALIRLYVLAKIGADDDFIYASDAQQRAELEQYLQDEDFTPPKPKGIVDAERQALLERLSPDMPKLLLDKLFSTIKEGKVTLEQLILGLQLDAIGEEIVAQDHIRQACSEAVDAVLHRAPYFMPKAKQEKVDDTNYWVLNAEKIYLPLRGWQDDNNFTLFGLDEPATKSWWSSMQHKAEQGKIGYRYISKDQNCSGVAINALLAGGAETFVPFSASLFAETPADVQRYALQLQSRIDTLNQQSEQIQDYYQRQQHNPLMDTIRKQAGAGSREATLRNQFQQTLQALPSDQRARFNKLSKAIDAIPGDLTPDSDTRKLTQFAMALVDALGPLLNNPAHSPENALPTQLLLLAAEMHHSLKERIIGDMEPAQPAY
ncbi:MAG: type III secretion system effector BopA family protein [Enterobacteriaceae bacterium]